MARSMAVKVETSIVVLEAAKKVLRQNGYSKLSTRDVAAAAGVPLSQIHYHFGIIRPTDRFWSVDRYSFTGVQFPV